MTNKTPKGQPGPRNTGWQYPEAPNVKLIPPGSVEPPVPNWQIIKSR